MLEIIFIISGFNLIACVLILLMINYLRDKIDLIQFSINSMIDTHQMPHQKRMEDKIFSIQIDQIGFRNEIVQVSDDLEALRRTIHEMKSDIKRISSVFAPIPLAEVPND